MYYRLSVTSTSVTLLVTPLGHLSSTCSLHFYGKLMEKDDGYKTEVSISYPHLKSPIVHTVSNQKLKCSYKTGRQPSEKLGMALQ